MFYQKGDFLKCDRIFYKLKFCTLGLVTLFWNNNNKNRDRDNDFSLSRQLFNRDLTCAPIPFPPISLSLSPLYSFPLSLSPLSLYPFPPLSLYPFPPSFSTVRAPNMCVIIDVLCILAFKPFPLCSFIIQFAGLFLQKLSFFSPNSHFMDVFVLVFYTF